MGWQEFKIQNGEHGPNQIPNPPASKLGVTPPPSTSPEIVQTTTSHHAVPPVAIADGINFVKWTQYWHLVSSEVYSAGESYDRNVTIHVGMSQTDESKFGIDIGFSQGGVSAKISAQLDTEVTFSTDTMVSTNVTYPAQDHEWQIDRWQLVSQFDSFGLLSPFMAIPPVTRWDISGKVFTAVTRDQIDPSPS